MICDINTGMNYVEQPITPTVQPELEAQPMLDAEWLAWLGGHGINTEVTTETLETQAEPLAQPEATVPAEATVESDVPKGKNGFFKSWKARREAAKPTDEAFVSAENQETTPLKGWARVRAAFNNKVTELQIGSAEGEKSGVRRALGTAAVGLAGVVAGYYSYRLGVNISTAARSVVENQQAPPVVKLASMVTPEHMNSFGSDVITPSSGTGTFGHDVMSSSPSGSFGSDILSPDTTSSGSFGSDVITPRGDSVSPDSFHLAPGDNLWHHVQQSMPDAKPAAVQKEVVRIMGLNHMPTHAAGPDPLEAARHIRPEQTLVTR
jgi:hypothetical protein